MDSRVTPFQHVLIVMFTYLWQRVCGWAAGCNMFVPREDFEAIGGFDSKYFAAEERYLSEAIRARGKFVILREHVITSARKLRIYSMGYLLKVAFHGLILKRSKMTSREGLEMLYDARREQA
jgi:hypothetical protein